MAESSQEVYNDDPTVIDSFQIQNKRLEAKESVLFADMASAIDMLSMKKLHAQVTAIKDQKARLEAEKSVMLLP